MEYRRQRLNIDRERLKERRPRRHPRGYEGQDREDYKSIKRIAITSILLITILIIKSIDRPLPQKLVGRIRNAITQDFEMRESIGRLKFVQTYSPKIKSVFNIQEELLGDARVPTGQSLSLIMPAKGIVIGEFEDTGGLSIQGDKMLEVISAADGKVILIDEHAEGYVITIRHSEELVTVYHNITRPYVVKTEEVKQGDIIGHIDEGEDKKPQLSFRVWEKDKPIDPKSLLRQFE